MKRLVTEVVSVVKTVSKEHGVPAELQAGAGVVGELLVLAAGRQHGHGQQEQKGCAQELQGGQRCGTGALRRTGPDRCLKVLLVVTGSRPIFAALNAKCHEEGIHPDNYRLVVFRTCRTTYMFLSRSCASSSETVKWEDGNEYPLVKLDISNTSHPFYTGKMMLVDTAGRVDKFNKRYARQQRSKYRQRWHEEGWSQGPAFLLVHVGAFRPFRLAVLVPPFALADRLEGLGDAALARLLLLRVGDPLHVLLLVRAS